MINLTVECIVFRDSVCWVVSLSAVRLRHSFTVDMIRRQYIIIRLSSRIPAHYRVTPVTPMRAV